MADIEETPDVPATAIDLQRIDFQTIEVPILGATPLIVHRWSEKAIKQMQEKQAGRGTRAKKDIRDPEAEYESSMYRMPDGSPGFPSAAFKAAAVGAVRNFDGLTMVQAKQAMLMLGEGPELLVPILGEPEMRTDMVRVGMGTSDMRYRAMFSTWGTILKVTYNPAILTVNSVMTLIQASGFGGVGEWRPSAPKSATGTFGMFNVFNGGIEQLRKEVYGE